MSSVAKPWICCGVGNSRGIASVRTVFALVIEPMMPSPLLDRDAGEAHRLHRAAVEIPELHRWTPARGADERGGVEDLEVPALRLQHISDGNAGRVVDLRGLLVRDRTGTKRAEAEALLDNVGKCGLDARIAGGAVRDRLRLRHEREQRELERAVEPNLVDERVQPTERPGDEAAL